MTSDSIDVSKFSYTRKNDTKGNSSGNGSGTGENKVSAFNSDEYQPDTNTRTNSETNTSYNDSRAETYDENVKASERLEAIERRLRLYRNNVYVTVAGWFADELLICVW